MIGSEASGVEASDIRATACRVLIRQATAGDWPEPFPGFRSAAEQVLSAAPAYPPVTPEELRVG